MRALQHPVARILFVLAFSRAIQIFVLLGVAATSGAYTDPLERSLDSLLCRYDCGWYVEIVTKGYSAISANAPYSTAYAFFPLYPTLLTAFSAISPFSVPMDGILLSNVFFALALIYVYYYSRDLGFRHRTGMLAVSLLCFAPPTIVFSSAHTESLFLLLLAASVFHLRRGEYLRSGVAAALLSATRPNGIAFLAFAAVWVARRFGPRAFLRPWLRPEAFLPIVLAPLGLFTFWAFSFASTGDAFAHINANFHGWGWGMTNAYEQLTMFTRLDVSDQVLIGLSFFALALTFLLLRYGLWEEFALCIASFLILWTGSLAPWSLPRYVLALFPLAVVVARSVQSRPSAAPVLVGAAATINGFVLVVFWALGAFVV